MCVRKEAYAVHLDGGMAELMVVPERVAYRLPPSTAPAIGALTEPLGCCVHGMDRLSALSGLPVLIIGTGPAGAILVALARQSSLHPVVAADLREDRRDLAFRMGADVALDPGASDFTERALAITHGDGFAYVVDAVGSPAVLETCLRLSARRATILVFGVAHPDAAAAIRPNEIYTKELTILGTAVNPFTHLRAVDLLASLPLHQLRIASYRLEDALTAMTAVRAGLADKVQIVPNPPSGQ
jgi:threonine dehydrogenase-like Zn-dependent dehydrogenase